MNLEINHVLVRISNINGMIQVFVEGLEDLRVEIQFNKSIEK